MALSRDEVVRTAIGLLDKVGLQGLTLRRLGKELGVSAPTLYWHVKDKRELLDLMSEAMMADYHKNQPPMTRGMDPWEKIAEIFRRQYFGLLEHRDGAQVVAGNRPTEESLPRIDNFLGFWMDMGFPPEEAIAAILSIGNYVIGSALEYQAEADRARDGQPAPSIQHETKERYPNLKRAIAGRKSGEHNPHRLFEYGLALLIAGLRARLDALKAAPSEVEAGSE